MCEFWDSTKFSVIFSKILCILIAIISMSLYDNPKPQSLSISFLLPAFPLLFVSDPTHSFCFLIMLRNFGEDAYAVFCLQHFFHSLTPPSPSFTTICLINSYSSFRYWLNSHLLDRALPDHPPNSIRFIV